MRAAAPPAQSAPSLIEQNFAIAENPVPEAAEATETVEKAPEPLRGAARLIARAKNLPDALLPFRAAFNAALKARKTWAKGDGLTDWETVLSLGGEYIGWDTEPLRNFTGTAILPSAEERRQWCITRLQWAIDRAQVSKGEDE